MEARTLASVRATGANDFSSRRAGERKVCRVSGVLRLRDREPLRVRLLDISVSGIAILSPQSLAVGTLGEVHFTIGVNGSLQQIIARVEVTNSVFLSAEVRIGCRFLTIGTNAKNAIAEYVR